ncbi:putative ABC transporter ATP-binding protein [bioreactor metagenome]|uniref:Putative ABC transporter ATP-binding protein n=1 Tax=bioreactor metagenome TaxID=1076179 RepID=A0A644Y4B9_9ZZZZ
MYMPEEQDFAAKKIDWNVWKRLYRYALKHRKNFIVVIVALFLVAGFDIAYPLFTKYAIDNFVVPKTVSGLAPFAILYAVIILIQGFSVITFIRNAGSLEMSISYDIRQDAFTRLQELSFSFYDRTAVGYIMARMVSDIARLSEMIAWSLVDILWSLLFALGCITTMFALSWKLALIALAVLPPLAYVSMKLQKLMLKYQREARKQNSRITGAFNEGIMGAVTTKTLVREQQNADEFSGLTEKLRHASIKSALISASFFPIVMSLGAIGTGLALSFGGAGVLSPEKAFIGAMTAGTLVAFVTYCTQLFDPIQQLANIIAEMLGSQASAERVITLMNTEPDVVDSAEIIEKYGTIMQPKPENWEPIVGDVKFDHVSFQYKNGEKVLDDFCLDVRAGQTIALVGETGAGKSTIVNLLCRFYEPTEGGILVDGVDYRERSQLWLQSSLGYVLQTPHLFSGTIKDNIRFGKPDATDEEVHAAARLVHAEPFILAQEKGYDTEIGESGARLSTGQKQLLSFARVVLKDPRIFVLDEATSSIDTETEQLIQNAITHILNNRTSFIVAHRLSTIRTADRILVIRNGRIEENGTHEELLNLHGYYYDLYTQQFCEDRTAESLGNASSEDK